MGDVLSQAEIDALLNAMNEGGQIEISDAKPEKNIRNYDFARPSKFSKDHLRTLENIFDSYSRLITTYLTGYLRTTVAVEVLNAEQITYSEFSNSLSNPVIFSVLEFSPLKGSVILEMSAMTGFAVIDRVLGGPGEVLRKMRDFSEIEKILIERVITQLLSFLIEPWESVTTIKPRLNNLETSSQFSTIMSPNEMVALVTLVIKVGEVEGFIHFCLPHFVLEPIISRLNTRFWYSTVEDEYHDMYKDSVEKQLETTQIPIRAILGRTTFTVNDFVALQIGDIVTLDSFATSDLDVMVGNLLKFHAKPGTSKSKSALQITSVIKED